MVARELSPTRNRPSLLLFSGIAVAIYAAALPIARALPVLERPEPVALGLTLDLLVAVPLAFYFLVVRRRGWPVVTVAPLLILSFFAAAQIFPPEHRQPLHSLKLLAAPLELGALSWLAWRAARAVRSARSDRTTDPLERLRHAALELLRNDRAAEIFAAELAVFYYALGSWRARPDASAGEPAFTHHRRSAHPAIAFAFLMVLAVEGLAVHLLLSIWSPLLAWILTAGTAYSALWLIADCRATVLRPILLGGETLVIRAGLRWTLTVPRDQVVAVARKKPGLGKECLNLTFLGAPTHWLTFSQPVLARGPYGLRRRVRAVGLQPDDGAAFERSLGLPAVIP